MESHRSSRAARSAQRCDAQPLRRDAKALLTWLRSLLLSRAAQLAKRAEKRAEAEEGKKKAEEEGQSEPSAHSRTAVQLEQLAAEGGAAAAASRDASQS